MSSDSNCTDIIICKFNHNPLNAEIICKKTSQPKACFQLEIIINVFVAISDSFEYLCYRSTIIINIFTSYSAGIDFGCQSLTSIMSKF